MSSGSSFVYFWKNHIFYHPQNGRYLYLWLLLLVEIPIWRRGFCEPHFFPMIWLGKSKNSDAHLLLLQKIFGQYIALLGSRDLEGTTHYYLNWCSPDFRSYFCKTSKKRHHNTNTIDSSTVKKEALTSTVRGTRIESSKLFLRGVVLTIPPKEIDMI